MAAIYELLNDDPRMGLQAGDLLLCEPYWLDPASKVSVIKRLSDGFDPGCNQYRSDVRRLTDDELAERNKGDGGSVD